MRVGELGERSLVRLIAEQIDCRAALCAGADDCAAIAFDNRYVVVTTDMLHRKTHFPREMTGYQVGWMATAASLSDIAAMGAAPLGVTMAIGVPRDTEIEFVLDLVRGSNACCIHSGTTLLGGDTDEHDELTLVGTAFGSVDKDKMLRRHGATPGDVVCITGELGLAAAGVRVLLEERQIPEPLRAQALKKLFEPAPQIAYGQQLAQSGAVTALIDTSDGLSISLYELARASSCGFCIRAEKLPISAAAEAVSDDFRDKLTLSVYRGGDYELLFTATRERLADIATPYSTIGEVTRAGMTLEIGGIAHELKAEGYEHLSPTGPKV
ncbi:MAG: thiamine-phosphate kinase [Halobacteriota archaeon]